MSKFIPTIGIEVHVESTLGEGTTFTLFIPTKLHDKSISS